MCIVLAMTILHFVNTLIHRIKIVEAESILLAVHACLTNVNSARLRLLLGSTRKRKLDTDAQ